MVSSDGPLRRRAAPAAGGLWLANPITDLGSAVAIGCFLAVETRRLQAGKA
jgi:hypothetical protein